MRVALTMAFLSVYSGGLAQSVPILSGALRRAGVEPVIVGVRDPRARPGEEIGGPGVLAHEPLGPRGFGYARGFAATLASLAPDVVDTQHLWMYPSLAALGWHRRTGGALVVTPRGMLDPWAVGRSGWKKRLARRWFEDEHLRAAACLRALCRPEAEAIRAFGLRGPVFIVPNAIPTETPATPLPSAGPRRLLFLGRIDEKKGVRQLLEAWRTVAPDAPDWVLRIVGWGDDGLVQALRSSLAGAGSDRVEFAGPRFGAGKEAEFRDASAFVLPSLSEGLPMSVLEAWSAGRAVVMTDACNLTEGFEAGAAIRVAAEPSSIAGGLRKLVAAGDAGLAEMGAAGRALVERRFSTGRVGADMARIYAWVAGKGPRPDDLMHD